MLLTLAVIGALGVLAVLFRLSGIKRVSFSLSIGGDDQPAKQLNK